MTDQSQKKDAGKARYDLIPWADITVTDQDYTPAQAIQAVRLWWSAKPHRFSISVPARQLPGIAAVLGFGTAKYAARGWEAGISFSRVFAAATRHALAWAAGEHIDPESGLAHESHFWCNLVFLQAFAERGLTGGTFDDRPVADAKSVETLDRMHAVFAQLTGQQPVSSSGLVGAGGKGSN
jgi:hypothetical protein